MVKVNGIDPSLLVEAVLAWTGWGREVRPLRDDNLLIKLYGAEVTAKLLPVIKSLEDEFYASDARFVASNLSEMHEIASTQFVGKHPGIANEIVRALAWCYTFDFK